MVYGLLRRGTTKGPLKTRRKIDLGGRSSLGMPKDLSGLVWKWESSGTLGRPRVPIKVGA